MTSGVVDPVMQIEARAIASTITRGARRLISSLGFSSVCEMVLPNGRRADVVGLSSSGEIIILEVKSCLADYLADNKWGEYKPYCDRFFFAVAQDGPSERIPQDAGLIIADAYSAEIVRSAPVSLLSAARRRAILLAFARHAADRLHLLQDPNKMGQ
jgi:hypothetical protein